MVENPLVSLFLLFATLSTLFAQVSLSVERKRSTRLMSSRGTVLEELSRGGTRPRQLPDELVFALHLCAFTGLELSQALAANSCWIFAFAHESLVPVLVVHVWSQFIEQKRRTRRPQRLYCNGRAFCLSPRSLSLP